MTSLLIIQEENITDDIIEKIKCLDRSDDLGIFFQFSGVYAIEKIISIENINAKFYACKSSIERRNIYLPSNIIVASLGILHELCSTHKRIKAIGSLI